MFGEGSGTQRCRVTAANRGDGMTENERKKSVPAAKQGTPAMDLEDVGKLGVRARRRHIRDELEKVACQKPQDLARVIKAWLEDKK